jgi:UDP-N-acetylglucosamine/UDP-N-acetylgalactosamine diphosphorylase
VLAMRNGHAAVVEYSELSTAMASEKGLDGHLRFGAANIAIHCLTVEFIDKAIAASLPYHVAHKKIPTVNDPSPTKNNGVKLEKFIFDGLALASSTCAYMVERKGEFTAVKNAPGRNLPDSPDTARQDVNQFHRELIHLAGGTVTGDGIMEISPLISYAGEDLAKVVKGKTFATPMNLH